MAEEAVSVGPDLRVLWTLVCYSGILCSVRKTLQSLCLLDFLYGILSRSFFLLSIAGNLLVLGLLFWFSLNLFTSN